MEDDKVGKVFSRWTIVRFSHKNARSEKCYECVCTCGNMRVIPYYRLTSEGSKSCGCLGRENNIKAKRLNSETRLMSYIGKCFNSWTVINYLGKNTKGKHRYLCKCICGEQRKILLATLLSGGYSKSCGCNPITKDFEPLSKDKYERKLYNKVWQSYVSRASRNKIPFELSKEYFIDLINSSCHYCGELNTNSASINTGGFKYVLNYVGIDRVDNTQGYLNNNVVPCCKKCNYAKRDYTKHDFTGWIITVANHLSLTIAATESFFDRISRIISSPVIAKEVIS